MGTTKDTKGTKLKRLKRPIERNLWAAVGPEGALFVKSLATTRSQTRRHVEHTHGVSWETLRRRGWEIIKVRVSEIEGAVR